MTFNLKFDNLITQYANKHVSTLSMVLMNTMRFPRLKDELTMSVDVKMSVMNKKQPKNLLGLLLKVLIDYESVRTSNLPLLSPLSGCKRR